MKNTILPNNKDVNDDTIMKSVNSKKLSKSTKVKPDDKHKNTTNLKGISKEMFSQVHDTIHYFQNLIQKTILAIQGYKKANIVAKERNLKIPMIK